MSTTFLIFFTCFPDLKLRLYDRCRADSAFLLFGIFHRLRIARLVGETLVGPMPICIFA